MRLGSVAKMVLLQLKELAVFFLVGVSSWCIIFFSGGSANVRDYDRWEIDSGPYPDGQAKNIFWFVQVSTRNSQNKPL